MMVTTDDRDNFEKFLILMDDQLEAVENEANKRGLPVDLAMDSLENLEKTFLSVINDCTEEEKDGWIVTFARYIGEIVRICFNGQWHLSSDDPKNIYYNTPVIVNHTQVEGLEFSPIFAIRALSIRKRIGILRQIIMADVAPVPLNIEYLRED